ARTVEGVPTHHDLSRVSPRNPVILTHASGHASFANARALELAGITRATRNPPGGEIVKDERGEPTGLLRETAQGLVRRVLARDQAQRPPEAVAAEARRAVQLAGEELLRKGVTSFHDAGSSFATIDFLRELAEKDSLPVRLYVMVRGGPTESLAVTLPGYRLMGGGDGVLRVGSVKRPVDGALGAHGAWMLEPYVDLPASTGLVVEPVESIRRTAEIAI